MMALTATAVSSCLFLMLVYRALAFPAIPGTLPYNSNLSFGRLSSKQDSSSSKLYVDIKVNFSDSSSAFKGTVIGKCRLMFPMACEVSLLSNSADSGGFNPFEHSMQFLDDLDQMQAVRMMSLRYSYSLKVAWADSPGQVYFPYVKEVRGTTDIGARLTAELVCSNPPDLAFVKATGSYSCSPQKGSECVLPELKLVLNVTSGVGSCRKDADACASGYQLEFDDHEEYYYCRLSSRRVVHTQPKLGAVLQVRDYRDALDCKMFCEQHKRCVLAVHNMGKFKCYIYGEDSFVTSDFIAGQERPHNIANDEIAFLGSATLLYSSFASQIYESLQAGLDANTGEPFLQKALNVTCGIRHLAYYAAMAHTSGINSDVFLVGSQLHAVKTSVEIAEVVWELYERRMRFVPKLPALDGPSTVDHILMGQKAIEFLETSVSDYKRDRNLAGALSIFEERITEILGGQVDAVLQQGNFDFKFLVEEFFRYDRRASMFNDLLEESHERLLKLTKGVAFPSSFETTKKVVHKVGRALSAIGGIFKKLLKGDLGAIGDMAAEIRGAKEAVTEAAQQAASWVELKKTITNLHDQWEVAQDGLEALRKVTGIAVEFIDSYNYGEFEMELTEEKANEFLNGFASYNHPYNSKEMMEINIKLSKSFNMVCDAIFSGSNPIFSGIWTQKCQEIEVRINEIAVFCEKANDEGFNSLLKAQQVISQYLLVKKNSNLLSMINSNIADIKERELPNEVLLTSSSLKLWSLNLQYMLHTLDLCILAEYYDGGRSIDFCEQIRGASSILSSSVIFSTLQKLMQSFSVPSSFQEICGHLPLEFEYDSSGNMTTHSLSLELLADTGQASFSFAMDETWLRRYGWHTVANGIKKGKNFFVERIELPLPYASLRNSSCGLYYDIIVTALGRRHTVVSPSGLGSKDFVAGSNFVSYPFVYGDADKVNCRSKVVRNLMEVCTSTGSSRVLPEMCISTDGTVVEYLPFNSRPPLPSMFSSFMVEVDIPAGCLELPRTGTERKVFAVSEHGVELDRLESHMMAPICLGLRVTHTNSVAQEGLSPSEGSSEELHCNHCPPGEFHFSQQYDKLSCRQCPGGTYQAKSGRFACEQCPPGTYQPGLGATTCSVCPENKICNSWGLQYPDEAE